MMRQLIIVALLAVAPASALAEDLPGVKPGEPIVQPLPEPLETPPASDDGRIKVGDWDVKVSGAVIVDIGTGNIKPPKK